MRELVRQRVYFSLSLRRGEILGLAGLIGAGRTELGRAIFGIDRLIAGALVLGMGLGAAIALVPLVDRPTSWRCRPSRRWQSRRSW